MSRRIAVLLLTVATVIGVGFISQAISQDATPPAGGDTKARTGGDTKGTRTGRGNFDPAAFRKQMEDRMKEAMGATDDEWKVLQPKIEKVTTLQRQSRPGMGMMMGSRGGAPGGDRAPSADRPQSDVEKKMTDLNKVLQNKEASADEIKTSLTAVREAQAKAKADLEAAQKDLKGIVTVRQEAVLVTMGVL